MLYFQIDPTILADEGRYVVNDVVERLADADRRTGDWLCRWDFPTLEVAEQIANNANKRMAGRRIFAAVDSGPYVSPRFDVVRASQVGDKVSYAFNGDSYPDGTVTAVSASLRVVRTDTGSVYYRRKSTGTWIKQGGTWSLIHGWRNDRNPCF